MILACDIGNTNIKTGLFSKDEPVEINLYRDAELFYEQLKIKPVDKIAISSVVPEITIQITKLLKQLNRTAPLVIDKNSAFNLKISYDYVDTLGIDRICSAEGAFFLYKNSVDYKNFNENTYILSIDLGTATTINIVRYPGEFIGGIISPGISLMFESLSKKTAQLPRASENNYNNFIGKNTFSSIASGVINSTTGLIENTILNLKRQMNADKIKIFITGGNAEKVLPYCNFEYKFVRELVLLGVKTIRDRNDGIIY
jgi:type III pantothenate kinase